MDKTVKINTEYIKLSNLLKLANIVSSGSEAKYLVLDSKALVNDEICTERGRKIYPGMKVTGEYEGEKFNLTVIS